MNLTGYANGWLKMTEATIEDLPEGEPVETGLQVIT